MLEKLKWLLNAFLMLVFMFLGLKTTPKQEKPDNPDDETRIIIRIIGS